MKRIAIILAVLMTMAPSGCELETILDEFSGSAEKVPAAEDEFHFNEEDVIIEFDDGEVIGGIGIGNVPDKRPAEDETDVQQSEVLVLDGVNYSKPIKGYTMTAGGNYVPDTENAGAYGNHDIRVPKIVDDAVDVSAINDKLYEPVKAMHSELLNDSEGLNTYDAEYYYAQNEKVIAIVQEISQGEQMIGGYSYYRYLYYDCQKHAEITMEEYIASFGFTMESFKDKLGTLEAPYMKLTQKEINNVVGVILDKDCTRLVIEVPDAIDPEPNIGLWTFNMGII